jgi:hypothetical protein
MDQEIVLQIPLQEKTKDIMHILSEWRERAIRLSDQHRRSKRFFQTINHVMIGLIVTLSSTSGSLNLSNPFMKETEERKDALSIAMGIMSLAAAGLTTLYNFFRLGEKVERHDFFEEEYEKLAREIRVEGLLADTSTRTYADMGILLKEIQDRFDRFTERQPDIPPHITHTKHKKKPRKVSNTF